MMDQMDQNGSNYILLVEKELYKRSYKGMEHLYCLIWITHEDVLEFLQVLQLHYVVFELRYVVLQLRYGVLELRYMFLELRYVVLELGY